MKKLITLLLCLCTINILFSQNLVNQFDPSNWNVDTFGSIGEDDFDYDGEFQVSLQKLYDQIETGIPGFIQNIYCRFECVSVPFQTGIYSETYTDYSRWLFSPDQSTLELEESQVENKFNKSFQLFESTGISSIYFDYFSLLSSNLDLTNCTDPAQLISGLFTEGSSELFEDLPNDNIYLPHSILKISIIVECEDRTIYEFPFVVDLTRGKARNYPFCDNGEGSGQLNSYDVTIFPEFVYESIAHQYNETSNHSFYPSDGSGTVNYFDLTTALSNPDLIECNYVYPEDLGTAVDQLYAIPPPYALLNAPMVNKDGDAYIGFNNNGEFESIFDSGLTFYTQEIPIQFFIDKPFDFSLINSKEKLIYLPESMYIGSPENNGTNIPTDFNDFNEADPESNPYDLIITLPSGYTFKTILGAYPSRNSIEAMITNGECTNWRDCHPESDVAPSVINIEEGSTLVIEECVNLFDVVIHVKDYGKLIYDENKINGRFQIIAEPNAILENLPSESNFLFCTSECQLS